jgi:hypothetical protein
MKRADQYLLGYENGMAARADARFYDWQDNDGC